MSNSVTRDVADRTRESLSHAGERASAMMHGAQETAADLSQRAKEGMEVIRDAASGYIDQGREKVAGLGRTVEGQVKEWPLSALLIATGVGLLLGIVLARR